MWYLIAKGKGVSESSCNDHLSLTGEEGKHLLVFKGPVWTLRRNFELDQGARNKYKPTKKFEMKSNEIFRGKNSLTSKLNSVDELSVRLVRVEGLDLKRLSRTQKDERYEMQGIEGLIEVLEN